MTTAQDQQSRAEFEALAESLGYDTTDLGHGFCHADTRKAQKVWQAARALPAGMEPAYQVKVRGVFQDPTPLAAAFGLPDGAHDLYTAAQVLATGCVPPVIYKATANYLALLREERRQLDRFLLTDRGFFRAKLLDGKIEELEEQLAVDRQVPAAPEVATGPCGQCKDARQPCQCALDTILKERGLVAVNRESFQHMVTKIAAASAPACWCAACDSAASPFGIPTRMSLCPQCGNKRCPRAQHHDSDCFASPKGPTP